MSGSWFLVLSCVLSGLQFINRHNLNKGFINRSGLKIR